jgi:VanZ family protein
MSATNKLNLLLLLAWCGLIFILSHLAASDLPTQFALTSQNSQGTSPGSLVTFLNWDKLHHAGAYAVMALLAWRTFNDYDYRPLQIIIISFVFCSLYGVSDEWHQSFIAGRESDLLDWFADTVGASITLSFAYLKELQPEFREVLA